MKKLWLCVIALVLSCSQYLCSVRIDRVILSTDKNPTYIDFWPLVAQAWKKFVRVKPTLALIATSDVQVDTSLGDVVRFEPIPGIPNWFYAQVIRLFLPALYPNDLSITADIDMLPLPKSSNYFQGSITNIADNHFVVYRDKASDAGRYPICYNAAKGTVWQEMFGIKNKEDIPKLVVAWYQRGFGWDTDEVLLKEYADKWHQKTGRMVKLGHNAARRLDRGNWRYSRQQVRNGHFVEAHMLRPLSWHRKEIRRLARIIRVRV